MEEKNIEEIKRKLENGEISDDSLDEQTKHKVMMLYKKNIESMMEELNDIRKSTKEKRKEIERVRKETKEIMSNAKKYKEEADKIEAEIKEISDATINYEQVVNKYSEEE